MDDNTNYLPGLGNANVGLAGKATEFFQKYKKQVLLGTAVAALGAGAYFLMKSKKKAKSVRGLSGASGTRRHKTTQRKTTKRTPARRSRTRRTASTRRRTKPTMLVKLV